MSIPSVLDQIKSRLTDELPPDLIRTCFEEPSRQHDLDAVTTTVLFARQVLNQNCSIRRLRHKVDLEFTESAYCRARERLDLQGLEDLGCRLGHRSHCAVPTWRGHRMWLIDGSSFSMPDTRPLQEAFGQPGAQAPGCGFPVAHLLCLFDAHTGSLARAEVAPLRTHDMAHAALTHEAMQADDVLVGDRAFGSYAHFALLRRRQCHGIFRAHQRLTISFRRGGGCGPKLMRRRVVRHLGRRDQLVEYHKPASRPSWISVEEYAKLPQIMILRETRRRIRGPGRRVTEITLVSTLLDPKKYPPEALAEAYRRRWQAEVDLRDLKTTLKLDVLRTKTVQGIHKEVAMMVIVYNLVRGILRKAASKQRQAPARMSFIDGLDWLAEAKAGEEIPRIKVNPLRDRQAQPRVLKRRPKPYRRMTQPRPVLQYQLSAA